MFQAGQQIGPYTLVERIGKGGFGAVWLAEKRSPFVTKRVAVKLPHGEQVDFDAIRQEATVWEQASGHPNVLPIIDADVYDGQVAIVSEYADGGSLADRLNVSGALPFQEAAQITVGILSGLEYLHSKNIIHRDIKPANILLQGGTPRLADFGISRAIETSTMTSTVVGTQSYMSPEAFEGRRSRQTDIWSVGVVLYKLVTGNLPFPQRQPSEAMYAVLTNEPEPLPGGIPQPLREIIFKALEKDRAAGDAPRRYQSAAEMRADLENFLETFSASAADADDTLVVSPLAPDDLPEETRVKMRIPTGKPRGKFAAALEKLFTRRFAPLTALAAILIFGAALLFAVSFANRTPETGGGFETNNHPPAAAATNSPVETPTIDPAAQQKAAEHFAEGNRQFQNRRYERAVAAYDKAIELNPNDFSFYNNRGLAFYARRKYAEAIKDFTRAVELAPENSITYNNRGVAFEESGDRERAINDYRRALELDPQDEKARRNLEKLSK